MAHLYGELRALSIEQLKEEYDRLAPSTQAGLSFIREEIARRELDEYNKRIESMTHHIKVMTVIITILTAVNVVAVLLALKSG